ncbi:hypothetical protein [Rhizobium sp. RAF56]|uniref:hypothetical protein n=1 Tax=Rhizobium sp. RAF56 TaxID=3233062 RepID=UPI003F9CDD3A
MFSSRPGGTRPRVEIATQAAEENWLRAEEANHRRSAAAEVSDHFLQLRSGLDNFLQLGIDVIAADRH